MLLDPEADGRVLTAPVPAHPHEADHVVPEVSRRVQLAVPDPLDGIGAARLVLQRGGRGDDQESTAAIILVLEGTPRGDNNPDDAVASGADIGT